MATIYTDLTFIQVLDVLHVRVYRGSAESHHLGHGDEEHVRTPKQVAGLAEETVVDIAVGSQHCLVLTDKGDVYGWGKNSSGEVDGSNDPVPSPKLIVAVSNQGVMNMSCGAHEVCESIRRERERERILHICKLSELCLLQEAASSSWFQAPILFGCIPVDV